MNYVTWQCITENKNGKSLQVWQFNLLTILIISMTFNPCVCVNHFFLSGRTSSKCTDQTVNHIYDTVMTLGYLHQQMNQCGLQEAIQPGPDNVDWFIFSQTRMNTTEK